MLIPTERHAIDIRGCNLFSFFYILSNSARISAAVSVKRLVYVRTPAPLLWSQTSISEGVKLDVPLTFSDPGERKKERGKKCTQTTNAEQGRPGVRHSSRIRDGYRFTGTGHENTCTRVLTPHLFFSTVTGQASTNRSAGGRKRPGSEGTVCVRVCMCEMIRLTACRKPLSPRAIRDLQAVQHHLERPRERK